MPVVNTWQLARENLTFFSSGQFQSLGNKRMHVFVKSHTKKTRFLKNQLKECQCPMSITWCELGFLLLNRVRKYGQLA